MNRAFSDRQKTTLFLAAEGKCQQCGTDLPANWHADHKQAWSKGGKTDVVNGQALCPECNLAKGAEREIWREWQERCFADWTAKNQENYLIAATPGCGKTKLALRIVKAALTKGDVERVIIVVPTEYLKHQWMKEANEYGIHIDPYGTRAQETSDFDGRATTYQAVLTGADNYRYGTHKPTIAVLDEIHHAGAGPWGQSLRHAFDNARYRILLSGTPFRTDQAPIPYVSYGDDNICRPDFEYTYKDALRDRILKLVNFIHMDGKPEWDIGGESFERKISSEGDSWEKNWGLRTAYHVGDRGVNAWIEEALAIADSKLQELRRDVRPDSAGIIFVENQFCARQFEKSKAIKTLLGEDPVVVYSDKKESKQLIEKFRKSGQKWIVSVRQISEGVDIPRLAVAVYATIETTELIFRQRVARVLRIEKKYPENMEAYVYIPEDPDIIALAQTIEQECIAVIDEDYVPPPPPPPGPRVPKEESDFHPGDTTDVSVTGMITSGSQYNASYEEAKEFARQANVPIEHVIRILALVNPVTDRNPVQPKAIPIADMVIKMKQNEDRTVGSFARKLAGDSPTSERIGHWKRDVNNALCAVCNKKKDECTIEDLQKRDEALKGWMRNGFTG